MKEKNKEKIRRKEMKDADEIQKCVKTERIHVYSNRLTSCFRSRYTGTPVSLNFSIVVNKNLASEFLILAKRPLMN